MSREGTEEGPLRFPQLGWGSSHRRGRSHYHSCLMTQTPGALWSGATHTPSSPGLPAPLAPKAIS